MQNRQINNAPTFNIVSFLSQKIAPAIAPIKGINAHEANIAS